MNRQRISPTNNIRILYYLRIHISFLEFEWRAGEGERTLLHGKRPGIRFHSVVCVYKYISNIPRSATPPTICGSANSSSSRCGLPLSNGSGWPSLTSLPFLSPNPANSQQFRIGIMVLLEFLAKQQKPLILFIQTRGGEYSLANPSSLSWSS